MFQLASPDLGGARLQYADRLHHASYQDEARHHRDQQAGDQ